MKTLFPRRRWRPRSPGSGVAVVRTSPRLAPAGGPGGPRGPALPADGGGPGGARDAQLDEARPDLLHGRMHPDAPVLEVRRLRVHRTVRGEEHLAGGLPRAGEGEIQRLSY